MIAADVIFQPLSLPVVIGLVVMLILIFCSALISGAEVAFFSLGPSQVKTIRSEKLKNGESLLELLEQPKRLLATILIANNFVNVAVIVLSTFIISDLVYLDSNPVLAFLLQIIAVTALLLIFGEIMPKILAASRPLRFALIMTTPFKFLINFFYPLSTLLVKSSGIVDRRISRKNNQLSMSELSQAIELTSNDNSPVEERKILKGIVKFGEIEAKEIMKPRLDVTATDISITYHKLLKIILNSGYSRIPVYRENFDQIVGILYVKDLLPHLEKPDNFDWASLLRPAFFVPETKKINYLLQDFQKKKIHLAVVVDEYGGTSGIVTLEDIIEEIVGDISDEFDTLEDEVSYSKIDDYTYLFEGKTLLNDFCKIINIEDSIFEDIQGDPDTLAGLIIELEGRIPKLNNSTKFQQFEFKITKVDNRRILQIQVNLPKAKVIK
ncbi:MAG: gliding motility-associated protein GldE [Bacteroidales bacterium]|nr:gliding motility-associated protein GldE [Bacteroidales bacterium]